MLYIKYEEVLKLFVCLYMCALRIITQLTALSCGVWMSLVRGGQGHPLCKYNVFVSIRGRGYPFCRRGISVSIENYRLQIVTKT